MNQLPETLIEVIRYFADPQVCHEFAVNMRWPDGVYCPHCRREANVTHGEVSFISTRRIWKCKVCRKQFSVKVGTIFEDSPLKMDVWIVAVWLIVNAKNGISSCEVARALGITQKSAWFVLHRVRHAMHTGTFEKLSGTIEVDETYVGGLEKNKHKDKKLCAGRGTVGKSIVMGVLQRGKTAKRPNDPRISQVRVAVVPDTSSTYLQGTIRANVETGSTVYTDAHRGYRGLDQSYEHSFIDHAIKYAEGRVSTNGIENFWNLLDRAIHGTYIKPEPQHLARYVDEQAFRFNHRDGNDLTRFLQVMMQTSGKRLTYEELTQSHLENMEPAK
jgi:transposase-like protein